jgi:alpha-D-xyloside xylohydrolase
VEDEYLFGSDMLVAPMLESGARARRVYLPPGRWIDYQSGSRYLSGWHTIEAGAIPVVLLVREGAVIPHIGLAQSTSLMEWSKLELVTFGDLAPTGEVLVYLPGTADVRHVGLKRAGRRFAVVNDPFAGQVAWQVRPSAPVR